MAFNTILFEVENNICTITINRPDKLNALNRDVFNDLEKAIDEITANAEIKSAIITGAGPKAFVAGADISEFGSLSKEEAMALSKRGQDVFFKIENCTKPIIAAVNGFALGGGCELAMACHFRICSENAKFGQPEVNLGLIPGYGGTQRLTQLIGKGRSIEWQITANMMAADEAYRIGLVNHITTQEQLLPKAKEILSVANSKAPIAIAKVIACSNQAVSSAEGNKGFEFEVKSFGECFDTADIKEGITAFAEKRKAVFQGK